MRRLAVVLSFTLAAACGDGPVTPATTKRIGATGGSFSHEGATVEIPSGALIADLDVSIETMQTAVSPPNVTVVGTPFHYMPEGQEFTKPVTVTLGVNHSAIPSGKTLADVVVYVAPAGSNAFEALPTKSFDVARVSATTSRLGVFVPGVATPAP